MSLGTRSFPYPVLASFNDDYLNSEFLSNIDLIIESDTGVSKITIAHDLGTTSDFLSGLQTAQEVAFYLDVFSKQTLFRQTYEVEPSGKLSFPNGELFGTVEVTPYLLTKTDITNFVPTGVHTEYRSSQFALKAGDVLGIGTTAIFEVVPDTSSLPELMTVELAPDLNPSAYEIDLQGSSILIRVGSDVMKYWEIASGDGQMKPNLFQGIYKDCIFFALQEIAQGGGSEDALWAKALVEKVKAAGYSLSSTMESHEINSIALELVSPKGLKKLLKNAEA